MKKKVLKPTTHFLIVGSIVLFCFTTSCSSSNGNNNEISETVESKTETAVAAEHGVGPVTNVELAAEIEKDLALKGKELFDANCTACHKFGERYVGPDLADVYERRNPAWIMNMIINPVEMTQKDPIAKQLLGEYLSQMADQNLEEEQARAILEYLRETNQQLQQ